MRNDLYYSTRRALSQLDGQCSLFLFLAPLGVRRRCGIKKGTENFHSIANALIRQSSFLESKDDLRNMH